MCNAGNVELAIRYKTNEKRKMNNLFEIGFCCLMQVQCVVVQHQDIYSFLLHNLNNKHTFITFATMLRSLFGIIFFDTILLQGYVPNKILIVQSHCNLRISVPMYETV